MRDRVFRDPVHGLIELRGPERPIAELLETRAMQRLRRIRQMGLAWLVYPGAEHSRFSHALGALHIAQRVSRQLKLEPDLALHVKVAALCHDVGHGPFSHAWEHVFPGCDHERWGARIVAEDDQLAAALEALAPGLGDTMVRFWHKTYKPAFALLDRFPRLVVSSKLFEVDRDRCSCSGGIAPVEMMIHLIGLGGGGHKIASAVAELMIYECRGPDERQKTALRDVAATSHPKLVEAIKLMECNIEELLTIEEIATHMQFSARQLERLFREELNCTPRQYYLQLRLDRARQLLTRATNRPIPDIVMACGFVSFAHFSHRYHASFGSQTAPPRSGNTCRQ